MILKTGRGIRRAWPRHKVVRDFVLLPHLEEGLRSMSFQEEGRHVISASPSKSLPLHLLLRSALGRLSHRTLPEAAQRVVSGEAGNIQRLMAWHSLQEIGLVSTKVAEWCPRARTQIV